MNEVLRLAETDVGGSPLWRWVLGLLVSGVVLATLLAIRRVATKRLRERVRHAREAAPDEHNRLNDFVLEPLQALHGIFLLVLSLYLGATASPITAQVQHIINTAMVVVSLVQLGMIVQQVVGAVSQRWLSARQESAGSATLAAGMRFAVRVLVWSAIFVMVLANLGVEISALVAGLGVGGVAAALAVQNLLGDLFASLALYFDRPFDIGDAIAVDDDRGTVIRIGLRSTQIQGLSGEEIVFPNANLTQSRIHNYRRMTERRVVLGVGVLYGTSPALLEQAVAAIKEVIESTDKTRLDRAHFKGFGASSLDLEAVYYVLDRDYTVFMDCQQAVNLEVMRRFEKLGLDFAFPTRTLHLESVPKALEQALAPARPAGNGSAQTSRVPDVTESG